MRDIARARALALGGWWYLSLLLPTLVFKYRYLTVLHYEDFARAVLATAPPSGRALYFMRWFAADILWVFVAVIGLWGLAWLLRIPRGVVVATSAIVAFVIATLNEIALEFTQQLLSRSHFQAGVEWTFQHFGLVARSLDLDVALIALFAVVCALAPIAAARQVTEGMRAAVLGIPPSLLTLLLLVAGVVSVAGRFPCSGCRFQDRSYWHLSLEAWRGPRRPMLEPGIAPTLESLVEQKNSVLYPLGYPQGSDVIHSLDPRRLRRRHIVVVVLETAPRKYYDLGSDKSLPTFHAMRGQALTNRSHFSAAPTTKLALQALLSGSYPAVGMTLGDLGRPDGIGNVLRSRGYETTYIDSYRLGWERGSTAGQTIASLGFERIVNLTVRDVPALAGLSDDLSREYAAFHHAGTSVIDAERRGRRALVVVATSAGHWPWEHQSADGGASARGALHAMALALDEAVGAMLLRFKDAGLSDEVMVLVTGDHGLRFGVEFESLAEPRSSSTLAYNVPFILYAPGLFTEEIALPYATSHVDVTPTLLELNGISTTGMMHHGEQMLNSRLDRRVTFLLSYEYTPVDRYWWAGCVVTVNTMTGRVSSQRARKSPCVEPSPAAAHALFAWGRALFAGTAALSLQRSDMP